MLPAMRGQTRYYMFVSAPTGTQWDRVYPQLQPAGMPPKQEMLKRIHDIVKSGKHTVCVLRNSGDFDDTTLTWFQASSA